MLGLLSLLLGKCLGECSCRGKAATHPGAQTHFDLCTHLCVYSDHEICMQSNIGEAASKLADELDDKLEWGGRGVGYRTKQPQRARPVSQAEAAPLQQHGAVDAETDEDVSDWEEELIDDDESDVVPEKDEDCPGECPCHVCKKRKSAHADPAYKPEGFLTVIVTERALHQLMYMKCAATLALAWGAVTVHFHLHGLSIR